jgi:uncharacterized 2Fe-2S/4Fe-4S cluster protein (DUF4445 family)
LPKRPGARPPPQGGGRNHQQASSTGSSNGPVDPEDISTITLAGNTTMTQLLLKVNPRYIRRSPYVPASTFIRPSSGGLGLDLGDHVTALVYPAVSSYVGGDIVAGVMGSGMYRTDKLTLFMDIGTNAEIVIGNRDWMACAACSAGPAFEGGGINSACAPPRGHRGFLHRSRSPGAHAHDHRQRPRPKASADPA